MDLVQEKIKMKNTTNLYGAIVPGENKDIPRGAVFVTSSEAKLKEAISKYNKKLNFKELRLGTDFRELELYEAFGRTNSTELVSNLENLCRAIEDGSTAYIGIEADLNPELQIVRPLFVTYPSICGNDDNVGGYVERELFVGKSKGAIRSHRHIRDLGELSHEPGSDELFFKDGGDVVNHQVALRVILEYYRKHEAFEDLTENIHKILSVIRGKQKADRIWIDFTYIGGDDLTENQSPVNLLNP